MGTQSPIQRALTLEPSLLSYAVAEEGLDLDSLPYPVGTLWSRCLTLPFSSRSFWLELLAVHLPRGTWHLVAFFIHSGSVPLIA